MYGVCTYTRATASSHYDPSDGLPGNFYELHHHIPSRLRQRQPTGLGWTAWTGSIKTRQLASKSLARDSFINQRAVIEIQMARTI